MTQPPLLDVRELSITVRRGTSEVRPVTGMSFAIRAGETVGMVGASGAGKTLTALAILGLLPPGFEAAGSVRWRGRELLGRTHEQMRDVRGAEIGFVPQDSLAALHPLLRVNDQIAEAIAAHRPWLRRAHARGAAHALLQSLHVPQPQPGYGGFPFQWSGGMRQRAVIAMAVANRPALVLADEPTTALDLGAQAAVLRLLRDAQRQTGAALLLITHDMAVIAQMADRVVVVGAGGRVVEQGAIASVRQQPRHAETIRLVDVLRADHAADVPPPIPQPRGRELLRVSNLSVRFPQHGRMRRLSKQWTAAVEDVSFALHAGETLGIVGESGGGKSTLARALVRLERAHHGRVELDGQDLSAARGRKLRAARASIQLVFQDPGASLNPRRRVGSSIAQPLHAHGRYRSAGGDAMVATLLEQVELPASYAHRFPHELSGGERQRVAIARALALQPRILILDEPVTALDAAVRAGVLRLLRQLQASLGLAYVFITHDLRLVRGLAHEIAVMRRGRFVELAATASLFAAPHHEYTRELLALTPQCACCAVRLTSTDD